MPLLPLLRRWRFRAFLAGGALGFSEAFLQRAYAIYLGHTKVIHYRDGYPVVSLGTPAVFSKPAANFLARQLYRTIQNRNLPNLMSLAVNDACDAACGHCSFFEGVDHKGRRVLSTAEMVDAIRQAQELGVSLINFVGGEPLLRQDLPALLRAVDRDLSNTVVFTNGSRLAERVRELRAAGLDGVYVSLDGPDAARHDARRGVPGLFDRALAGLAAARRAGCTVGISCTLTPEAFEAGELDAMVALARRTGAHELLVFDAMPTGRLAGRADLVDGAWVERLVDAAARYHRDPSAPGVLVWAYTTGHRAVGCACGTSYFYLSPYGDVMSCDFNHAPMGSLLDEPLYRIWDRMSTREEFCRSAWGGCKVKNSAYRDLPSVQVGRRRAGSPLPVNTRDARAADPPLPANGHNARADQPPAPVAAGRDGATAVACACEAAG